MRAGPRETERAAAGQHQDRRLAGGDHRLQQALLDARQREIAAVAAGVEAFSPSSPSYLGDRPSTTMAAPTSARATVSTAAEMPAGDGLARPHPLA